MPHRRGRHHAEIRQHRVAPADARQPVKDVRGSLRSRAVVFERRAGIGDRDEMLGRLRRRPPPSPRVEEIRLEDVGLERAAGLARHDEQGARRIDLALERGDLRRVGRIEHDAAPGSPACAPKVSANTSGPRLDPPMPSSSTSREAGLPDSAARSCELRRSLAAARSTMPSQPIHLASSASVHSEASPAHSRRTLPSRRQSSSAACDLLVERRRQLGAHLRRAWRRAPRGASSGPRRRAGRRRRRTAAPRPRPASR